MKLLFIISTMANYMSFFLSIVNIFKKSQDMETNKYRFLQASTLTFWCISLYLFFFHSFSKNTTIGLAYILIQLICFFCFWSSTKYVKNNLTIVFSKNKPKHIVSEGPYRRVRHPFYTIYIITYLSTSLILNNLFLWIIFLIICFTYFIAAKFEERKFFNSDLKTEYDLYKKRTGMFFPKIL